MEFKKLSDVEVVETVSDSANVLIEEEGVIKKAPKSQVGGGGASSEPIVIEVEKEYDDNDDAYYFPVTVYVENYEEIKNAVLSGRNVLCIWHDPYVDDSTFTATEGKKVLFYPTWVRVDPEAGVERIRFTNKYFDNGNEVESIDIGPINN